MKKILVTGGAGFIGSNYINTILSNSDDLVVNIDKLTYAGNLENLKEIESKSNYRFVKGDICNFELIDYLFTKYKFTHVVNFAAESHVDRSILGSEIFFRTNVIGTNVLLEAAKRYEVRQISYKYPLMKFTAVSDQKDCLLNLHRYLLIVHIRLVKLRLI